MTESVMRLADGAMPFVHGFLLQMTFQGAHRHHTAAGGLQTLQQDRKCDATIDCIGLCAL
jgi:hypothetical protein